MKKAISSLSVIMFALALIFVTCKPKSPEELGASSIKPLNPKPEVPAPDVEPAPERPFILLSQLAFESQLTNARATMPETRAMYATVQEESNALATGNATRRPNFEMSIQGIDICPCPQSVVNCPCPRNDSTAFVSQSSLKAIVAINNEKIVPSTVTGKDGKKWDAFKLPADMKPGVEYKMTIKGEFAKKGQSKSFVIPVEVKDGKLYPKW